MAALRRVSYSMENLIRLAASQNSLRSSVIQAARRDQRRHCQSVRDGPGRGEPGDSGRHSARLRSRWRRVPARQRGQAERGGKIFRHVIEQQRPEWTNCPYGSRCRTRHFETRVASQVRPSCQGSSDIERGAAPGLTRTGGQRLWRKPVTQRATMLFRAYAIVAVLTFIFQMFVRIPQCADTGGCAISVGKGLLWSIAWPAGWAVYLKGAL